MKRLIALATLSLTALLPSLSASDASAQSAQAWPARVLRLIVPYPPGGNVDAIARFVADKLSPAIGQPILIENKAGAGATIGAAAAAQAAGDGYTLLVAPTAVFAITPHLRKVPYDPIGDFVPIAQFSGAYSIVTARKDAPFNNMKEMVAAALKAPGKYTFGSAGVATATHITGEMVNLKTGMNMLHVPYKGSADALTDLVGGRIDLIYDPVSLQQVKAGNVKALAVTSDVRHPELPNVPTLKEEGYDIDPRSWFGLFAPKGTPRPVVERVAVEVEKILKSAEARDTLLRFSQYPDYLAPAPFSARVREDSAFFKDLVTRANIRVD